MYIFKEIELRPILTCKSPQVMFENYMSTLKPFPRAKTHSIYQNEKRLGTQV